jgi:hypothetical protein
MGIQTPIAQGRSTKTESMIKWTCTSRLSIMNSFLVGLTERDDEACPGSCVMNLILGLGFTLGPCSSRPMPRALWWSYGGGGFL